MERPIEFVRGFCGGCRYLIQENLGEFRCSIDNDVTIPFYNRVNCPIIDELLYHDTAYKCHYCVSLLDDKGENGPALYCCEDECVYERKHTTKKRGAK